jgi:hypothetical protein
MFVKMIFFISRKLTQNHGYGGQVDKHINQTFDNT